MRSAAGTPDAGVKPSLSVYNSVLSLLAEAYGLRGPIAVPRDAANRPVYAAGPWQFNVSHHGDYVVLAAHAARPVGVDVMDCERPQPGTTTAAFLGSLRAQVWLSL